MRKVLKHLRWLVLMGVFVLGLYLIAMSYPAYALWQEYLALGDLSGAEFYEIDFKWRVVVGAPLVLLASFLAGIWSGKAGSRKSGPHQTGPHQTGPR